MHMRKLSSLLSILRIETASGDERSAAAELSRLLEEPQLKGVPLLVLANKIDLPSPVPIPEITEKLGLSNLSGRKWHIQGTNALMGQGLTEAFDWIVQNCL